MQTYADLDLEKINCRRVKRVLFEGETLRKGVEG
jgi:hypothetical protein